MSRSKIKTHELNPMVQEALELVKNQNNLKKEVKLKIAEMKEANFNTVVIEEVIDETYGNTWSQSGFPMEELYEICNA